MKKFLAVMMCVMTMTTLAGCNKQIVDFTYAFNEAIVYLPNGEVVKGAVESWTDYEDGDQIQVKINGVTYLVHSSNIALIKEK